MFSRHLLGTFLHNLNYSYNYSDSIKRKNFVFQKVLTKMQLYNEMSPPAFVRAQLELECTCSVPRVYNMYMQCRLNVGYKPTMYIGFGVPFGLLVNPMTFGPVTFGQV